MSTPGLRHRDYFQFCWVVPDVEAAIHRWVRTSGAGPFFIFENQRFTESRYRGVPTDIAPHRAAIGQAGNVQIELIRATTDERSIWTEFIPPGGSGFHHAALYCSDYESERAAYLASGAEMAFEGRMKGAKTGYIDTVPQLGFMTQLITANAVADSVFGQIRKASEGWDGREPIRTLG